MLNLSFSIVAPDGTLAHLAYSSIPIRIIPLSLLLDLHTRLNSIAQTLTLAVILPRPTPEMHGKTSST